MNIVGLTEYRGYHTQQHDDFFDVFRNFITEVRPSQILEIGTGGGGFILFIRDVLNEIGLQDTKIKTFDTIEREWYDTLRGFNIEILVENIFTHPYDTLLYPEKIESFIQQKGTTVVFCDGGYKIGEFNSIAPLLKHRDFILAHDYVDTKENFIKNYKDKIWNWCEVDDSDIENTSNQNNLVNYKKGSFEKVVWVCKQKINT